MNQTQAMQDVQTATPLHERREGQHPTPLRNPTALRIAYIEASWHYDIVERARPAFVDKLSSAGILESQINLYQVPGSLEIPLQAQLLAESGDYDIIVACGLIVDGGIYRHDFVARTVIDAMMRVQLDTKVPVLSVVLTPHNFHESSEHHDFFYDHFVKKGEEAGNACLATLGNMQNLKQQASA